NDGSSRLPTRPHLRCQRPARSVARRPAADRPPAPPSRPGGGLRPWAQAGCHDGYDLFLAGLSVLFPGLSRLPLWALSGLRPRCPVRSPDTARWLLEASPPAPEAVVLVGREAGGWLPGPPAASTAAGSRSGMAPVLPVPALSTTRARATPRTAPSSAPITTRSWPSRRSDRFTWPPGRVLDPRYVAEAARAQTHPPLPPDRVNSRT